MTERLICEVVDENHILTAKERRYFQLIGEGLTSKQIGARLHVSPRTAETHIKNLQIKLNATNTPSLVAWATAKGLVRYTVAALIFAFAPMVFNTTAHDHTIVKARITRARRREDFTA